MGACGDYEHMSLQPRPPQVLNVKCLTGRLSEEKLQRAVAPLEPGEGGSAEAPTRRLGFCQLLHGRFTLYCNNRYVDAQIIKMILSWLY